ncbi:MAG: ABC transporter transmembrane domain-containing protein, partial [Candidatus Kariarchaeaceae archaeon]
MSWIIGEESVYDRQFSDRELLSRYVAFIKPYWRYLIIVVLAILMSTGFTLIIPLTLQSGVDALISGQNNVFFTAAYYYLLLNFASWLADAIQTYYNTKFTAKTTQDLRYDLFSRVQNHDMSFFDKNKTAKILTRIMDDTTVIAEFVGLSGRIASSTVIALGTVVILFFINFQLTLLALAVVPILIVSISLFRKVARRLARDWRTSVSQLNDSFQENISGIKVAKSFGKQDQSKFQFETLNQENYWINFKKSAFFASIFPIVFAISNVGLFLVLYGGGMIAINGGDVTAGTIV